MNTQEFSSLDELIQRLRRQLWYQRVKRGVVYGAAASAFIVLVAGIVHLSLLQVSVALWLPLAVLPPLVAGALNLIWQRPGAAQVVELFDRHAGHAEFLVSAWEARNTPVAKRCAGAQAVLLAANSKAPHIVIPADWAAQQQQRIIWLPAYSAAVWVLFLAGIFALQLPPQPAGTGQGARVVAKEQDAVDAIALPFVQPASRMPAVNPGQRQSTPDLASDTENLVIADQKSDTLAVPGDTPIHSAAQQPGPAMGEVAVADDRNSILTSAAAITGGTREIDDPAGNAAGTVAEGAPTPADEQSRISNADESFELQLRYADIARQIATQVQQTIAGGSSVAFTDTGSDATNQTHLPPRKAVAMRVSAMPYNARFSPSQRAQINAYFDYLEITP